jgi:hypothetical protein
MVLISSPIDYIAPTRLVKMVGHSISHANRASPAAPDEWTRMTTAPACMRVLVTPQCLTEGTLHCITYRDGPALQHLVMIHAGQVGGC